MFYCIVCKRIHDDSVEMQSFGSGFRTRVNGATIKIGVCKNVTAEQNPPHTESGSEQITFSPKKP